MHHLFVMSVDALFTTDLADVRHLPGFAEVLGRGAGAAVYHDVYCVYPTLTYVCHATMASGCWPMHHGVPHNQRLNPAICDRDWYWEYASMRVPTVFDWAKRAGLTTANVGWPVTAGAPCIDHNVPEVWTVDPEALQTPEATRAALDDIYRRGCSSSGYELYEAHRDLLANNKTPELDEFDIACVEDIIHRHHPDVLYTHQAQLDHARHLHGVHAPQVQEALRMHDAWLQRVIAALKSEGIWDDTIFVFLGDHGHIQIDYQVCPNVLLAKAGLIDVAPDGNVAGWRAYVQSSGASGQLFLRDQDDLPAARRALQPLLDEGLVSDVFTREEVRVRFHEEGEFALMLEAAPNHCIGAECTGELVVGTDATDYKFAVSTHGHLPFRGEKPCFVVSGPGVAPGHFAGARLVDEAPTLMDLAGIPYDPTALDGESLVAPVSRAVRLPQTW